MKQRGARLRGENARNLARRRHWSTNVTLLGDKSVDGSFKRLIEEIISITAASPIELHIYLYYEIFSLGVQIYCVSAIGA